MSAFELEPGPIGPTGPAGAGGGGDLTALFDSTLAADAASIDTGADGVPQTHAHLFVIYQVRGATAVTNQNAHVRFNNDSGANYDYERIGVVGGGFDSGETLAVTQALVAEIAADSAAAGAAGAGQIWIPNYAATVFQKNAFATNAAFYAPGGIVRSVAIRWRSTAAITRIALFAVTGDLLAGSRMTIYGLGV